MAASSVKNNPNLKNLMKISPLKVSRTESPDACLRQIVTRLAVTGQITSDNELSFGRDVGNYSSVGEVGHPTSRNRRKTTTNPREGIAEAFSNADWGSAPTGL